MKWSPYPIYIIKFRFKSIWALFVFCFMGICSFIVRFWVCFQTESGLNTFKTKFYYVNGVWGIGLPKISKIWISRFSRLKLAIFQNFEISRSLKKAILGIAIWEKWRCTGACFTYQIQVSCILFFGWCFWLELTRIQTSECLDFSFLENFWAFLGLY